MYSGVFAPKKCTTPNLPSLAIKWKKSRIMTCTRVLMWLFSLGLSASKLHFFMPMPSALQHSSLA